VARARTRRQFHSVTDPIVRPATIDDADTLVRHRYAMFHDMGHSDTTALDEMCVRFKPWVIDRMNAGEYLAWLAVAPSGDIAAGAGLWLMDWLPHMVAKGARRGNIVNVYTEPAYRRRGLAKRLVLTALACSREHGADAVILHASPDGRALYESLGFKPTNEMRIHL